MVSELISKYIWLIQIISGAGSRGLTFSEIADRYERLYGQPYPRRTFNNHREVVADILGIEIVCDRSTNSYKINYSDDALDKDSSVNWLVNTFAVKNVLDLGKERLSGRVAVENAPSGEKFLTPVMQAMEDMREVVLEYVKYTSSEAELLHVQPFAVKNYKQRWYLVGYCHERALKDGVEVPNSDHSAWRVYGLDRIHSVKETDAKFRMPKGFDVDSCFAQSYGVFLPDPGQTAEKVRFWASEKESKFLRDLPLHPSQKEESNGGERGSVFSIRVIPNVDLVMEFCRRGAEVEVLEPKELRKKVAKAHKKSYEIYSKKK